MALFTSKYENGATSNSAKSFSNQIEGWKWNCVHGVSADNCTFYFYRSYKHCIRLSATFDFFSCKFSFAMGRNLFWLNSFVNPALYFYRNKRYRKAAPRLFKFGKPWEIRPAVQIGRRKTRHRDSFTSVDVKELIHTERVQHFTRSHSGSGHTHEPWSTDHAWRT